MDFMMKYAEVKENDWRRPTQRSPSVEDIDPKERRKEQNRIAQRKYRKLSSSLMLVLFPLILGAGRKMAEQARQAERIAQQAHHVLTELVKSQSTGLRCPECYHCQSLALPPFTAAEPSMSYQDSSEEAYGSDGFVGGETVSDTAFLEDNFYITSPAIDDSMDVASSTKFSIDYPFKLDTPDTSTASGNDSTGAAKTSYFDTMTPSPAATPTVPTRSTKPLASMTQKQAAIHLAASKGQSAIVTILLRSGAEIDSRDSKGRTPLFHAAKNGHLDTVQALLAAGADPSIEDSEGTGVLLAAVEQGEEEIVEILMAGLECR